MRNRSQQVFDLVDEGLVMGGSTGVNVAGAIRMARELGPGHTIVTVLCDYGNRYASKLFNPEFLRSKDLPVPEWLDDAAGDRRAVREGRLMALRDAAALSRRRLSARLRGDGRRRTTSAAASSSTAPSSTPRAAGSPATPAGSSFGRQHRCRSAATVYGEDKVGDRARPGRTGDSLPAVGHAGARRARLGAAPPPHAHAHGAASPLLADPLSRDRRARSAPTRAGSISTSATPDAVDKDELTERLNALVAADHPVTMRWITDEELADNPGLVRTMSVKPPTGSGRGAARLDRRRTMRSTCSPAAGRMCARPARSARVAVTKIEKKGRQNRRIRLAFAEAT